MNDNQFMTTAFRILSFSIVLVIITTLSQGAVFLDTDFEGASSLPSDWTESVVSGNANWTISSGGVASVPAGAHGGSNNARLYISNTSNNQTRIISPVFDTAGQTNITLTFWHAQGDYYGDQDELKVFYSLNGGTDWTELAHYTADTPAWTLRTIALPAPSTSTCIAFEGNAMYGHGVCLDDILVDGIPETWSEVSVTATDPDASEAGLDTGTWTITRTGNTTGALNVNFSLSGNATQGSDYNVDATSPLSFAPGETSKVVTLTPIDDSVQAEGEEVATFTITSGTGYAIDVASSDIGIYDDEGFGINILVIGSTNSFSEGGEHDVVHEKPFDPTAIADHLKEIINHDPAISNTVNVEVETVFKTKPRLDSLSTIEHCYSLAQHYFWPEGKAERLANLRGEAGTKWDYIVLCGDPYIMANFPGMFAEGVELIRQEAAQSTNAVPPEVILLAQWPENSSIFSAGDFNEVVHRVGGSAGLRVVAAGKVWDSYTSQDTDTAHPTPRGAYLAAASIYSKLYGRSAKTSSYSYASDGDNIADHAFAEVQAIAGAAQYSGLYSGTNTFTMKVVNKRRVAYKHTGTSTENGILDALYRLDDLQYITFYPEGYASPSGTRWDFNYGRGNDGWEDEKDYEVNTNIYDRSYGFPMHYYTKAWAPLTMPYGIDKHYISGSYEDGTDLGIAYNMVRPNTRETGLPEGHDVRAIPIRLMCAKIDKAYPGFQPLVDDNHMGPYLNNASAAFMYTLLSGRCPVEDEPETYGSTEWMHWIGYKVGYETAWQMSHLTTRAPGLRVLPSSRHSRAVTTVAEETMTVRFMNPPQSNVTVIVTVSDPSVATVSPSNLVFTPSNYDTVQEVTVTGLPIMPDTVDFDVVFTTSSDDVVYDGVSDSWPYQVLNTTTETDLIAGFDGNNTANGSTLTEPCQSPVVIEAGIHATLSSTYAMSKAFQWTAAGQWSPNTWGTLMVAPPPITNNATTVATLGDPAELNFTIDNSAGTQAVAVAGFHFLAKRDAGAALEMTIAYSSGALQGSNTVLALVNDTGVNHAYDIDLTSMLTDHTLGPGESATFKFSAASPSTGRLFIDNIAISGNVIPLSTNLYTLTYLADVHGSISGVSTQTVNGGNSGSPVEAVADTGYRFDQWSDGSIQNPRTDDGVTSNITVTASFVLDPISVTNNGSSASNATSAVLSGWLTGGTSAAGWICWGDDDAGVIGTGDWDHVISIGAVSEATPFYTLAAPLETNKTYWYRCYVTNGAGEAWSENADIFSGTPAGIGGAGELITVSTDNIQGFEATVIGGNSTDGSNYPGGEDPPKAIDGNTGTKYLNFGKVGSGFYITPGTGTTVLTDVRVYTANDASGRDPLTVSIEGANGGDLSQGSSWTLINSSVNLGIDTDPGRLTAGPKVSVAGSGPYASYRIIVQSMRNTGDNSTQYSEFELYGIPGGDVSVVANTAPGNISDSAATFYADLNAASTNYDVYVFYGSSDEGTNATAWATSDSAGSFADVSTNISYNASLTAGTTYYYTFMASNSAGVVWAEPSWQFTTLSSGPNGTHTLNHLVPYSWLDTQDANWATNYDAMVMADPDGDDFTTWQEYWAGTDPRVADSCLKIDAVHYDGTNVEIAWRHARIEEPIPALAILATTNLITGSWVVVGTNTPVNGTNIWSESIGQLGLYYKLAVTNAP